MLRRSIFALKKFGPLYREQIVVASSGYFQTLPGLQNKNRHVNVVHCRHFRITPSNKALPPLLWAVIRPIAHLGAIIFGRTFRRWWFNLPPDRQRRYYEWFMKNRRGFFIGGGVGVFMATLYLIYHIERTPVTKRLRFVTMTRKQFHQYSEFESDMLLNQFQSMLVPENDHRVYRVKRIARKILDANFDYQNLGGKEWFVHVVKSPIENCMVLPNGHIFVFTGMLDNVGRNDDQLAIILGHEMAHCVLGHGLETISLAQFFDWIRIVIIAIIWAIIPLIPGAVITDLLFGAVFKVAQLPFSRNLESEADKVGLEMAAKACFDPRESYAFWVNMQMKQKVEGTQIEMPEILSSHPNHGDRAERLGQLIDEVLQVREKCNCPPLKTYDPRVLADFKKRMIEQELAMRGRV